MNSSSQPFPGLGSLYRRDFTIKRGVDFGAFALVAAFGIRWASQPVPSAVPVEVSPLEDFVIQRALLLTSSSRSVYQRTWVFLD